MCFQRILEVRRIEARLHVLQHYETCVVDECIGCM
jgi:hypothetical protein